MRAYWDSTALLNALAAQSVLARLDEGEHLTRSHAYVEAFHHLPGRSSPCLRLLASASTRKAQLNQRRGAEARREPQRVLLLSVSPRSSASLR
jgi:hypothetical protein